MSYTYNSFTTIPSNVQSIVPASQNLSQLRRLCAEPRVPLRGRSIDISTRGRLRVRFIRRNFGGGGVIGERLRIIPTSFANSDSTVIGTT